MTRFDDNTAVRQVQVGQYRATIDPGWWIVSGPNGGYVGAIVERAARHGLLDAGAEAAVATLRSLTLHYLRPPAVGDVDLAVTVERVGRTVATVSVRMTQGDRLMVLGLATCAATRPAEHFDETAGPPVVAPPEEVPAPIPPPGGSPIEMTQRYEMRPCLGAAADGIRFGPDVAPGPASSGGWIRFAEPTPVDSAALVALSDAWMPPVMHRFPDQLMAVPTVDLTVHVRQLPADPTDWVLASFSSPVAVDGYVVEDAQLWDRHGSLLAVSRQLAVLM